MWKIFSKNENSICIVICNSLHYEMIKNIKKNLRNSYIFPATSLAMDFLINNKIPFNKKLGYPKVLLSSDFLENNQRYFNKLDDNLKSLIEIKKVKKIQTYHGVVDKNWTYSKHNFNYNLLLVPGLYSKYRLIKTGIPKSIIKIIGFTKFSENFFTKNKNEIKKSKKTILYAPTYGDISSLPQMIKPLSILNKKYQIIFKPHYYTKEEGYYVNIIKKMGIKTYEKDDNIEKLFSKSDILISDTSSIMFEFLLTKKPVISLDFHISKTGKETLNSKKGPEIIFRNLFYRASNISQIEPLIKECLNNYDYNAKKRIVKILFDDNPNPGKKAANEIINYIKSV